MTSKWRRRSGVARWILLFFVGVPIAGILVVLSWGSLAMAYGLMLLCLFVFVSQSGESFYQLDMCPTEFDFDEEPTELSARVGRILGQEVRVRRSVSFVSRRKQIWHEGIACELESGQGLLVRIPTDGRPDDGRQPVVELHVVSVEDDGRILVGSWSRPLIRFEGAVSAFDCSLVDLGALVSAYPQGQSSQGVSCEDVLGLLRSARPFDSFYKRMLIGPLPNVRRLQPGRGSDREDRG